MKHVNECDDYDSQIDWMDSASLWLPWRDCSTINFSSMETKRKRSARILSMCLGDLECSLAITSKHAIRLTEDKFSYEKRERQGELTMYQSVS